VFHGAMRRSPTLPRLAGWCGLAALLVALPLAVKSVVAQPAERHEERKERREDRREDRRDDRKEHRDDLKDEWRQKRAAWRDKREDRRHDRREALRAKWGDLVLRPPVRAELGVHARRVARLERIEFLAEATANAEAKEKAIKLLADEDIRFNARMDALKVEGSK
jgi:hypothetical protein